MSDHQISNLTPDIIVTCPHCDKPVLIEQLNCYIFRHAVSKSTGQQIDPHSSKDVCEQLVASNKIFGCGKPFKISIKLKLNSNEVEYICEPCDYI